jgi:hypothetical protein
VKHSISLLAITLGGLLVLGCSSTEGQCESLCAFAEDCDDDVDEDDCIEECVDAFDSPSETCDVAFETFVDCADEEGSDCDDVADHCEDEFSDLAAVCDDELEEMDIDDSDGDPCETGEFDSCVSAFNGYCEQGGTCPIDTDYYDCYCIDGI